MPLRHPDLEVIALLLPLSNSFTQLALSSTSIDATGAHILSHAVRWATTLQDISLWDNHIGCDGATSVANALAAAAAVALRREQRQEAWDTEILKHAIRNLNLSRNELGDRGAGAVSKLVGLLPALQALDLSENPRLTVAVGKTLGKALVRAYVLRPGGVGGLM